jgi:hypothetical protein
MAELDGKRCLLIDRPKAVGVRIEVATRFLG